MAQVQLGLNNPAIQVARRRVAEAQPNLKTGLENSKKIVVACENFDLNQEFLTKSADIIRKLIEQNSAWLAAVKTLEEAGENAGNCVTETGIFNDTKRSIAEVTREIQENLEKPVVQTALRTLGIIEQPKAPAAPFFSLPERPSNGSLAKAGIATFAIAGAGTGIYFRESIPGYNELAVKVTDLYNTNVAPHLPTLPSFDDAKNYAYTKGSEFYTYVANSKVGDFASYAANSDAGQFIGAHKLEVGVGVVGTIVLSGLIYKALQNRKSEQETQKA